MDDYVKSQNRNVLGWAWREYFREDTISMVERANGNIQCTFQMA